MTSGSIVFTMSGPCEPGIADRIQAGVALARFYSVPGSQRIGPVKPRRRSVRAADAVVKIGVSSPVGAHQLVEVIFVKMREDHEIDCRQILEIDGGIGEAGGMHSVADVNLLAAMQEVRIRQDRETLVADDGRRGSDEKDGTLARRASFVRRRQFDVKIPAAPPSAVRMTVGP